MSRLVIASSVDGTCPECGGDWQRGDLIRPIAGEWVPGQSFWRHKVCPRKGDQGALDFGEVTA